MDEYPKVDRRTGITIKSGVAVTISMAFALQVVVMVFQFGRMAQKQDETTAAVIDLRQTVLDLSRAQAIMQIRLAVLEQAVDRKR